MKDKLVVTRGWRWKKGQNDIKEQRRIFKLIALFTILTVVVNTQSNQHI